MKNSKVKYGLKKYVIEVNKDKEQYRTHPTYTLKVNDSIRWWQEMGEIFFLFLRMFSYFFNYSAILNTRWLHRRNEKKRWF